MKEMDPSRDDRLLAVLQKGLGHELPNRLLAIQGLAHLLDLEEGQRLGPDGKEYLQRLTAATQRTHALVKALTDLTRAARATELPERICLPEALREAAAEVKQLCAGARIEYDFPDAGPFARLPRASLRHVAVHLLRNAVQAAVPERPLCIRLGARTAGLAAEFWITDTGRGLAPEQQQRLFEPFVRRDAAAGVGLGLVLVRFLVEGWGGTLSVESAPDQGSTFRITLPAAAAPDPVETP